MTIKQTLTAIVLAAGLALGTTGCTKSEYSYKGKIGDEQVEFTSYWVFEKINDLTVEKADGTIVRYINLGDNLELERIEITTPNQKYFYDQDDKEILEQGQKQFDDYLRKISENKKEEESTALRNLDLK